MSDDKYSWICKIVYIHIFLETKYCIFCVGTQFWEAGKTLKFLAEQQYFNKDKTSTENPVKVCKSLYQAFGVALVL